MLKRLRANAALALAQFRNASGIIDPEKQAAVQLQMISKLQDELIGSRMQLLQLRAMAPENPQIPVLQARIAGLSRQIDSSSASSPEAAVLCRRLPLATSGFSWTATSLTSDWRLR